MLNPQALSRGERGTAAGVAAAGPPPRDDVRPVIDVDNRSPARDQTDRTDDDQRRERPLLHQLPADQEEKTRHSRLPTPRWLLVREAVAQRGSVRRV